MRSSTLLIINSYYETFIIFTYVSFLETMSVQVQVLYDFDGQPGSAELTIKTGDVLDVTRQDIGEGWWEGVDQRGNTGLFPAAYVEV